MIISNLNKLKSTQFKVFVALVALLIKFTTIEAQPYPVNYNVYLSTLEGSTLRVTFNTMNEFENGKPATFSTVLGINLVDPDGLGVGTDFEAFSVFVGTPDATISSLDGGSTININVIEITAANNPGSGLDGILDPGMTFEAYQPTVTLPAASTFVELFRSDRSKIEVINANDHQIRVTFQVGVTNAIGSVPGGIYTMELQFCLCAQDNDALPGCPPPF